MFSANSNNSAKITIIQIAFIFLILCQKSYSQERNWVFVGTDEKETMLAYVDLKPQKQSNGILLIWEKMIESNTTYTIGLVEWDCREKRSRTVQQILYNRFGEPLRTSRYTDWLYTIDGTLGASIFRMVCGNTLNSPDVSSENVQGKLVLAEIIVTAASLRDSPNIKGRLIREIPKKERLIMANEKPRGNWFKILDREIQSEGWLHKSTFRIIDSNKSEPKKKIRQTFLK